MQDAVEDIVVVGGPQVLDTAALMNVGNSETQANVLR